MEEKNSILDERRRGDEPLNNLSERSSVEVAQIPSSGLKGLRRACTMPLFRL